jgi:AcrR family transcriptional regulator
MTRARAGSEAAAPPPQGTRERLVAVAHALMQEGGYAAASVQAIADRAGLSAGALYRHFPSKAELFVEVYRTSAARDMAAIDDAAGNGTCVQRFDAAIATHARRALRNRRLAWALMYEPVDALVDEERLVFRRKLCRHMAGLLRQGIAAGEMPAQDVELTAAALIGAIAESLVGPLSPVCGQMTAAEDVISGLLRFCRRAVGIAEG